MSDSLTDASTFPRRDTLSPGRQRSSSRPKPVTEARAAAQRQKLDRKRAARGDATEQKSRQPAKRTPAPKASAQTTTVSRAVEGYIQDQIGGNRSKKTIEWHQTDLGLFSAYLVEQEQITLVTDIDAIHITGWLAHLLKTV
ncbi:MAG TPA: hypothetical protein VFV38_18050 [Ktedonobacteraceae bacterium]|nr:hypothetical protein [Ktedonobacteraceae bacterium]